MVEAKNTLTSCCILTSLVCFETRKYQKKSNGFSLSLENSFGKTTGEGGRSGIFKYHAVIITLIHGI